MLPGLLASTEDTHMGPPFSLQKSPGSNFRNIPRDAVLSELCLSPCLSRQPRSSVPPLMKMRLGRLSKVLCSLRSHVRVLTPLPILDYICSSFTARFPGTSPQDLAEQAHQGHYHPKSLTYPLTEKRGQRVQLPGKLCMYKGTGRRES